MKICLIKEKSNFLDYLPIGRSRSLHKVGSSGGGIDVTRSIYSFIDLLYMLKKMCASEVARQTNMHRRIVWNGGIGYMKDEGNAVAYDSRESDAQCPDGTYSAGTTQHTGERGSKFRISD